MSQKIVQSTDGEADKLYNQPKHNLDQNKEIKDKTKSLIDFSDFKDDIESFMYIDKNNNKYNQKTGKLDLTKYVFKMLKPMLKEGFDSYINHADFKSLILSIYGLSGNFHIHFNQEKGQERFILVNTSVNRISGLSKQQIEKVIFYNLDIKNEEELKKFLDEVIYGLEGDIENYVGKGFREYIYGQILEKINGILINSDKNNDILNEKIVAKELALKFLRENFNYIARVLGHKILGDISELILGGLLDNSTETINEKYNDVTEFLGNHANSVQKIDCIDEVQNCLNNDILIDFQKKILLHFRTLYKFEIDPRLLEGSIEYLIFNKNLNINIIKLVDSIFEILDDNFDDIVKLFKKYDEENGKKDYKNEYEENYNRKEYEENGEKYQYKKIRIRNSNKLERNNKIKNILLSTKIIINELKELEDNIKDKNEQLDVFKSTNYKYVETILSKEQELDYINNKNDKIGIKKDNNDLMIEKELDIEKKKGLQVLKEKYENILLVNTVKAEELKILIYNFNNKIHSINSSHIIDQEKINDLSFRYNNLSKQLKGIKEEFIRSILFSRRKTIKK